MQEEEEEDIILEYPEDTPLKEVEDSPSETPEASLPSPVVASLPTPKTTSLPATVIIPVWIFLSSTVIIYNNYLFNTLNFKYPVFLVTWHLTFAAIGTRVLQQTTHLLDGTKDVNMNMEMFLKSILPIGVFFSGTLIFGNMAYLYLSVSYIQMLKLPSLSSHGLPKSQNPIVSSR